MKHPAFFSFSLLLLFFVSCHSRSPEPIVARDGVNDDRGEKEETKQLGSPDKDPLPVRGSSYTWNKSAAGSQPAVSQGYTSTIYYEEKAGEKNVLTPEERPLYTFFDHKETWVVDPTVRSVFTNRYGTEFIIPSQALVYADGVPVNGKVHISFSEFRTTEELILSGIPMKVRTGNPDDEFLESAGMFDIHAVDESGKEVFLQNGENITVQMQVEELGEEYDIFRFEKNTGWITTDTSILTLGARSSLMNFRVRISEDEARQYPYKQRSTFIYLDWPRGMYPEIEPLRNVAFEFKERDARSLYQLAYEQQQQKELYASRMLGFSDQAQDRNTQYVYFSSMEIGFEENNRNEVRLVLKDTLGMVDGVMSPYYQKPQMSDFLFVPGYDRLGRQLRFLYVLATTGQAFMAGDYRDLLISSATSASAIFSISGFGIWNCDRKIFPGYNQSVTPVFVLGGQQVYPTTVSMVLSKNRSVFSQVFTGGQEHRLKYSSRDINLMYYAVDASTIAYVTDAYFKAIPGSAQSAEIPLTQVSSAVFAELLKNGELGISLEETAGQ